MNRYYSYLNSATQILKEYKGEEPFASFLKKYFAANKKYGSRDRKQISHLCYCYFRRGNIKATKTIEEKILEGLFVCSKESNEALQFLKPEWNDEVQLSVDEKLSLLQADKSIEDIFPFIHELSDGIDQKEFVLSHLKQPDVFLRLRPGKEEIVKKKLQGTEISFENISSNCLALPNASKIDEAIELDKDAVIQDYNSQKTSDLLQSSILNLKSKIAVWDCCSGSGGKSIMLYDLLPDIDLTVSDKRESILINLKKRFEKAGISKYKSIIVDLSSSDFRLPTSDLRFQTSDFDLILADVPCTGSGTWGRTPEQLYYFENNKIDEYFALQKRIVSNVLPYLKSGGCLLYITCSVFKKENEDVIDFVQNNFNLQLIEKKILKGYDKKADTMFVALLHKPVQ